MADEPYIFAGGIFCTAFAVFHLLFWKIFNWREDLRSLSKLNRAIMQVLNLRLTFVFVIFAYISFMHSNELQTTDLGKSLLVLISAFWFMRAIEQLIFFKRNSIVSMILFAVFVCGGILYIVPLAQ